LVLIRNTLIRPFSLSGLTSDYPGTGIGLALCKRIAENHNGTIEVESKIGEGTKFTLLLPGSSVNP
jgi:signal transduction histidine kinase